MNLIIGILIAIVGIVEQLRYLCLSQNNNYKLTANKAFRKTFTLLLISHIILFTLILLSTILGKIFLIIALICSILEVVIFIRINIRHRTKFKNTKRGNVYAICSELFYVFSITILMIFLKNHYFLIVLLIYNLIFPLIFKAMEFLLNCHFEKNNKRYIEKQSEKLIKMNPKIIGITGSYGKTSCKNILKYFLESEYNVVSTEKNYNTPMGIALAIEKMKGDEEILIVEMGARKRGDILELCQLFRPQYAIITGICAQHTETFGNVENICSEKYELAKAVKGKGACVFNTSNKYSFGMYKNYNGKKISACCNKNGNVYASAIKLSEKGSVFDLHLNDEVYLCKTNILGRHNVQNIVMCVALALELGCKIENLIKKMEKLPQTPHRLEYSCVNGINILDDGYNGNIYGVKSSFECLSYFPGKHVVVSQGIVEIGKESKRVNQEIGKQLISVADVVILCGVNAKYIKSGLKVNGFQGEIVVVKSFKKVKEEIKKYVKRGDSLLLQNDIPDIY